MDAHDIFRKLTVGCTFKRKQPNPPVKKQPDCSFYIDRFGDGLEVKPDPVSEVKTEPKEEDENQADTKEVVDEQPPFKKKKKELSEEKKKSIEEEQINHLRKVHHISVKGKNIVKPIISFDDLARDYNVSEKLVNNIRKAGYETPTPIQMQAIPAMLQGRQVFACAPTGSGKTAAFLIPIIHCLRGPKKQGFRAVILCPTRELAKQTYTETGRLSEGLGLRVHVINKVQQAVDKFGPKSSQKFDILITTPNKLVYLLKTEPPVLNLSNVEWLIVDESDKLFESGVRGFRDQLAVIYSACSHQGLKRGMFSATHTEEVAKWVRKKVKRRVQITVGLRNTSSSDVEQELLFVGDESGKLIAIRDLIQKGIEPPVLVFVQSKERAQELYNELIYDGINVDVIHSDRTQTQRDNVVRSFRTGRIWVLITTELLGRGIDFRAVRLVINYDFPTSAISYIHRIGRAGRAGRTGRAITLFTRQDAPLLRSIATVMKDSGCEVPDYMLKLKRTHKTVKKKLEKQEIARDQVNTTPLWEKLERDKIKKKIKRNLKKKKTQKSENEGGAMRKKDRKFKDMKDSKESNQKDNRTKKTALPNTEKKTAKKDAKKY
uniref:Probable ATP-dependent RNA helicase DDX52 n=1 Tax=Cacopsylla melanoneura TaxID=428564 RepID=A0A8D9A209_9HEMI